MSILSDRQIKNLSARPTHLRLRTGCELEWISQPYSDEEVELIKRADAIQWQHDRIREFDPEIHQHQSMIEPFVPHQVREENNKKIVSYGLSSYGYDIRIAPEFKIFTNINSTVIDPLDFDENSFVDFEGNVCIIPPNSFVLARSIEYFRMPKNVTGIVLAKSTYARTGMSCFTGETRIALVDGTSISFEEMIPRYNAGERFFGYSVNGAGNIVVAELTLPKMYREDKVLEVTLDNGEIIRATADHKFMLNDGTYVEAKDLTEGISLMPLYRVVARGYEAVIQPGSFQPISTHVLADAWNIQNGVYEAGDNEHRHHIDGNRRNNVPTNIERKDADAHIREHNIENWQNPDWRNRVTRAISESHHERMKDPVKRTQFLEQCQNAAFSLWNSERTFAQRERILNVLRRTHLLLTPEQKQERDDRFRQYMLQDHVREESSRRLKALWEDPDYRAAKIEQTRNLNIRSEITEAEVQRALETAGTIRGAAKLLNCDRTVFKRFAQTLLNFKEKVKLSELSTQKVLDTIKNSLNISEAAEKLGISVKALLTFKDAIKTHYGTSVESNHKVVSVREVEGVHKTYCLTVPEHGNFALEAGVFVKNCLATPLEAGWEGHITLEYANSTPLPMKLYANQGAAQVLFFEGEPCMTTYADRGGKYQGQTGITLPRG